MVLPTRHASARQVSLQYEATHWVFLCVSRRCAGRTVGSIRPISTGRAPNGEHLHSIAEEIACDLVTAASVILVIG